MMSVKGNYILVKCEPAPEEQKTASGLFIPVTAEKRETSMVGEVVAVGDGTWVEKLKSDPSGEVKKVYERRPINESIKPGRQIVYPRWAGYEIEVDEQKYLLVREHDILGYKEEE